MGNFIFITCNDITFYYSTRNDKRLQYKKSLNTKNSTNLTHLKLISLFHPSLFRFQPHFYFTPPPIDVTSVATSQPIRARGRSHTDRQDDFLPKSFSWERRASDRLHLPALDHRLPLASFLCTTRDKNSRHLGLLFSVFL